MVFEVSSWPLDIMGTENTGGSFLYHLENNQVVVGLIGLGRVTFQRQQPGAEHLGLGLGFKTEEFQQ